MADRRVPADTARTPGERGVVVHDGTEIPYRVVRSARRKKTIAVTVIPGDGVVVTAPQRASPGSVRDLVTRSANWILRRLQDAPAVPMAPLASGAALPYLGGEIRLHVDRAEGRHPTARLVGSVLEVAIPGGIEAPARDPVVRRAVDHWYRSEAADRLAALVRSWSARMGLAPTAVLVRAQKRRWGSCSLDGTLRFNWRLVMAEPALMEYVVVHELAHLGHRNHGPEFWATVAHALPDYRERRARLRASEPRLGF